jgi:hypothetical protein
MSGLTVQDLFANTVKTEDGTRTPCDTLIGEGCDNC